ncbi:MAG: MOSC domain-containing protein [Gammaproteobacteria bacterium]|jgi:uncharacterized protein|nr:MOSC domain-containing protein [Gammaproteobacteria bacterium]MBT4493819.1 MOSC domain-containing protein [Gammaproteobacteria bacterium]
MTKVGAIKEIWRFPVKSMQGDRLDRCTVSETGVLGDRSWAIRDEVRQEIQGAKHYPELMLCECRYRHEPDDGEVKAVDITFPDGEMIGSDDDRIHGKISELIGVEATLWPLQPAENLAFYKRYIPNADEFQEEMVSVFGREPGEPMPDFTGFPEILMEHVSVPGTFVDNEELNLITTSSIAFMQAKNPEARWDIRRFRPNFYVETVDGLEGLVENDWVGKTLRIGEVTIEVSSKTPRCGMVVRPQADLDFDKSILRSVVKEADQNLGVGAHCRTPGEIRVGDVVELI